MLDAADTLIGAILGGGGVGGVAWVINNPEKVEKWSSMLWWVLSRFSQRAEYIANKTTTEGRINSYIKTLEQKANLRLPRIKLKWIARNRDEEVLLEEGRAIIVMKDRKHRTKNLIRAAYLFTSETILQKMKHHLSEKQKKALDLFTTKKILDDQASFAVDQFMNDYFVPKIRDSEEMKILIKQFKRIDRLGAFFPILVQELWFLGNKVFLVPHKHQVTKEVKDLIKFLEEFAEREVGSTDIPEDFDGKIHTLCNQKLSHLVFSIERDNVSHHAKRVSLAVESKLENIYILGSSKKQNKDFINRVVNSVKSRYSFLQIIKSEEFSNKIKIKGDFKNVDTYLVHLRNPNAVRYLYEDNDIETLVAQMTV